MNVITALVAAAIWAGAQHPAMPAGMSHEEHQKQMDKDAALKQRGADAMGFDQNATVHHFGLSATGGSIEVDVRRAADEAQRAQIRAHLQQIAGDFARGDFGKPVATHAEVPPGVAGMQAHRDAITYRYEERPLGARVLIETKDPEALKAIQAFLRYQIAEHKTGDAGATKKSSPRD
jgi:hypothetical protein